MPQIRITVDIDEEVGDVSITIDEIHADGIQFKRDLNKPEQ